jgi:tetratricopeptide (TPR) repeat protein
VPLGEVITATHGGRNAALDRGREHNASIVLWGWFVRSPEKILVTVNFEVMRSPHSMTISSEKGNYQAPLSTLNEFTLQGNLSNELTTIVLAATALARMDVKDYWGAVNRLNEALNKRVSPQIVMGYDDIFLYSAWAYILATSHDGPESVTKYIPQIVNSLEGFIKIHNQNAIAFQLLGLAHILVGEYEKALADGRKILEVAFHPIIQDAAYQILFYAAQMKGDQKQEIEYAQNIVKNSKNLELTAALEELRAEAYMSLGDQKHALDSYDMALRRDADMENQIRIHRAKANIYYDKNETWNQALDELKQVTQLSPQDADAYNRMGNIFYWRKEYTNAISMYNKAIKLNSKNAMFYDNLGNVYRGIAPANLKEALANYNRAIEVNPKYAIAYLDRGSLYNDQKQFDKALPDLIKCLQLDPQNIDALYEQAHTYVSNGDFDMAISDYKKIIEINPNDATAFFYRGITFNDKGSTDKALEDFNAAIKLGPDYSEVYLRRGLIYATKGDTQKAKSDLSKVLQLSKDPKLRQQAEQQLKQLPIK